MNKVFILIFISLFASCKMHKSISQMKESQVLKDVDLDINEKLINAFLQRDYESLTVLFNRSHTVDTVLDNKKTLLTMGVEAIDYKMIDFLLGKGADPYYQLEVSQQIMTPIDIAKITGNSTQSHNLIMILESRLNEVNSDIFYERLSTLDSGEEIDLEWMEKLLLLEIDHSSLDHKAFEMNYLKNAIKASNVEYFYELLTKYTDESVQKNWLDWLVDPFTQGKYRKANCRFHEVNECESFESFLDSCDEKVRNKLEKAKSKIINFLFFRNSLLGCGITKA